MGSLSKGGSAPLDRFFLTPNWLPGVVGRPQQSLLAASGGCIIAERQILSRLPRLLEDLGQTLGIGDHSGDTWRPHGSARRVY